MDMCIQASPLYSDNVVCGQWTAAFSHPAPAHCTCTPPPPPANICRRLSALLPPSSALRTRLCLLHAPLRLPPAACASLRYHSALRCLLHAHTSPLPCTTCYPLSPFAVALSLPLTLTRFLRASCLPPPAHLLVAALAHCWASLLCLASPSARACRTSQHKHHCFLRHTLC